MRMDLVLRLKKLFVYRAVLWEMSFKKLKGRYSGSSLGIWWALIIPLLLTAAINFVFSQVFRAGGRHFSVFLISGLMPWFFFSNTLNDATVSFSSSISELRQNIFPRELIPFSYIISNFVNFLIGLAIVMPLFLFFSPKVILCFVHLLILLIFFLIFAAGIGLLFAVWNVFFKDLTHIMSVAMMVWFWLTPVFYSADRFSGIFKFLVYLNPLTSYISVFQKILSQGEIPSFSDMFSCLFLACVYFIAGYLFFVKKESELLKMV